MRTAAVTDQIRAQSPIEYLLWCPGLHLPVNTSAWISRYTVPIETIMTAQAGPVPGSFFISDGIETGKFIQHTV